jgi:hypothetical protein
VDSERKDRSRVEVLFIPVVRQSRRGMVERENGNASWTIHNMQPSLYFTVMTE